jgi:hypothetical protein
MRTKLEDPNGGTHQDSIPELLGPQTLAGLDLLVVVADFLIPDVWAVLQV